jgi:hypothetical protein
MEKIKKMKAIERQQMEFMSVKEPIKNTQNFKLDTIAQEVNETSSLQRQYFQNANNNNNSLFYRSSPTTIVTLPNNSEERST